MEETWKEKVFADSRARVAAQPDESFPYFKGKKFNLSTPWGEFLIFFQALRKTEMDEVSFFSWLKEQSYFSTTHRPRMPN